jgi:hypothetical protein
MLAKAWLVRTDLELLITRGAGINEECLTSKLT